MSKRYIANLDGLRFLAATTVACSHLEVVKSYATNYSWQNRFIENAPQISVTFFFVLSGFLIMWWFLEETQGIVQQINVKKFYVNRVSRTWPLYFLVLAISVVISIISGDFFESEVTFKRFMLYFFFLPNAADIFFGANIFLGPTWSLAVEEFFYLFFPLVLTQIPSKKLLKRLLILCLATLSFSIVFNPIFVTLLTKGDIIFPDAVHYLGIVADRYRFYSFLLGALSAYLVFKRHRFPSFLSFANFKQKIHLFAILLVLLFVFGVTFSFVTQQIYSILFALFLYAITITGYTSKLLNRSFVKIGGKISYGIYMLHMLIILRLVNQLNFLIPSQNGFLNILVSWGIMLGLTYLLSYLSFYYFEIPVRNVIRRLIITTKPGKTGN